MRRNFKLDEITVGAFAGLWDDSGKPSKRHYSNPNGYNSPRYFAMRNITGYGDFEELMIDLREENQMPRCIWFPHSDVSIGVATQRTMQGCQKYGKKLLEHSMDEGLRTLVVQMTRDFAEPSFDDDFFNFRRENGFWQVEYIHLRRKNFGLYTFEGDFPRIGHATPAVSAIFSEALCLVH